TGSVHSKTVQIQTNKSNKGWAAGIVVYPVQGRYTGSRWKRQKYRQGGGNHGVAYTVQGRYPSGRLWRQRYRQGEGKHGVDYTSKGRYRSNFGEHGKSLELLRHGGNKRSQEHT